MVKDSAIAGDATAAAAPGAADRNEDAREAGAYGAFSEHVARQADEIGRICLLHAATDVRLATGVTADGMAQVNVRLSFGGVALEGFTASVIAQLRRELTLLLGAGVAIVVDA